MDAWCEKQRRLLQMERAAEVQARHDTLTSLGLREQELAGFCLRKMRVKTATVGMNGRQLLVCESARKTSDGLTAKLPASRISSGDLVGVSLSKEPDKSVVTGVVTRLTDTTITLALDRHQPRQQGARDNGSKTPREQSSGEEKESFVSQSDIRSWAACGLVLRQLANTVTYRKLDWSINQLERASRDISKPCHRLTQLLIEQAIVPATSPPPMQIHFRNTSLNESQQNAVHLALSRPDIAVIHGPPGAATLLSCSVLSCPVLSCLGLRALFMRILHF
eukprot:m.32162 g.32162  ORF g.32162 m.32162 type:complete len:278 (+) comp9488_c0_seq3:1816-2649(+)